MADLGNQLEGAAGGLERLSEGFDNLLIKLTSTSALEAQMIKEKQTVSKQLAKANRDKIREEKRALPLQKKMTIQIQQRLKNSTLLNKGLKETIKSMNVFGKTMSGMKKGLGTVGKGIAAIGKAGIIGGLVVGIKFLIDGLLKVDTAMAGMSKRLGATRTELAGVRQAALDTTMELGKWGITFEQVTAEAGNLAQQFGSLKYVTDDLIKTSFKLQQVYGLTAQASGELLESLERTNKNSEEFIINIGMKAQKAGVLTSLVMKDLASQSQMIAIQSSRGVESMQNMAIEAAKAGVSMKDMGNIGELYADVEASAAAIGDATMAMGSDIQKHMGNLLELRMMYERGENDKILERVKKATAATVKVTKEGVLWNIEKKRAMYMSEIKYMAKLGNMTEDAWALMTRTQAKEMAFIKLKGKVEKGIATELERKEYKRLNTQKELVAEENRQNQVLKDRQTMIERLKSIATGVFERITLAFSAALGIDKTGKGSILDQIDTLQAKVEEVFGFKNLQKDIKDAGGGFQGFIDVMGQRINAMWETTLQPMFVRVGDWIGDALLKAVDKMIAKMRGDSLLMRMLLGESEYEKKQSRLEELEGQLTRGKPQRTGGIRSGVDAGIKDYTDTEKWAQTQEAAALQTELGMTGTPQQLRVEKVRKERAEHDAIVFAHRKAAAETQKKAYDEGAGTKYTGPVMTQALGGVHGRGRAALVGEAGGEVVVSRSALRSGIGVGGRAASALAGIGVPGFYRGGMVEGVTGRKGLMTGFGSEASRGAQAAAFQKEQAIQQAAMVNYWREYYQNKLNNMGGKDKDKKKDDLDWLKKFFNENKRDIDLVSQILLKNQKPAAKEMYKGVFTAMTAWSSGTKAKDALKLGVRAGLTESMKKGGTVYNLFEKSNEAIGKLINSQSKATAAMGIAMQSLSVGVQNAMATYAQTGDWGAAKESMKRTAISGGVTMLAEKLLGEKSMATAKQFLAGGGTGAASGKYVNSPTLMMVGEENRGEVVIPTERIKKGLPINAGVARELGSIGVPGFHKGGVTGKGKADPEATAKKAVKAASVGGSDAMLTLIEDDFDIGSISQLDNAEWAQHTVAPSASSVNNPAAGLADDVFSMKSADAAQTGKPPGGGFMSGLAGGAKASGAAAALSFAQVYMQTGNVRLAAQAGLEAGISLGATLAISAIPIPGMQLVGPLVGPLIGKYTAGPLGRAIGLTGGQKKARKRVLKNIEQHVKSGGIFDFGQPGGMRKNISVAVGGKENVPQEKDYNKLVEHVGGSKVLKPLWQAGIDPSVLVAAGSGKLKGKKGFDSFAAINTALYGDAGGDKYMKAMAVPQLADGGIVTRPTTAVIGEAGPEMVIPLHEQKQTNENMIKEMKEQNKLMRQMIKTQEETGKTEIRLDGRTIAQSTAENFYDIGNGM